ncbi:adenosylcobinamide amidohydrolase [Streptacidiphilus sp. NEAU-YB345]|uniref:Adenosylcobinamide amidohydrolase n=2 Tax=Streptacidiphilus fuscans TaxID=2789292 RepID=A0A931AWH9_9ACTN|nr:adenosylcobinamide amidohydrolase [Streptacidiphilus fuscans]
MLVWRAGPGWRMISSAVLGGGIGARAWVLNAQVRPGYSRMDPDRHLAELARSQGLTGPGVGLMTAAQVDGVTWAEEGGVSATVTTGIGLPVWAADPNPALREAGEGAGSAYRPGTINILAVVPAPVADGGLVNLLATATEAKVQGLLEAGYSCSGTPSDAVCVAVREPLPGENPDPFGGPRSIWGSRLARAVRDAVRQGALDDRARRAQGEPAVHAGPTASCAVRDVRRLGPARLLEPSGRASAELRGVAVGPDEVEDRRDVGVREFVPYDPAVLRSGDGATDA